MPAESLQRGLVRMSWGPRNLHSLWRLTYDPPEHLAGKLSFKRSSLTLFQQKWVSKRMLRAYHGDWIQERRLRRRFMPNALPPLEANLKSASTTSAGSAASTSNSSDYSSRSLRGSEVSNRIPLASLMWREVEARLDVLLFRACFTHSAYDARRMITQGHVKLNGAKCTDPNIILQPGDIFSVDPKEMYLLRPTDKPFQRREAKSTSEEASEETTEGESEAAESVTASAESSEAVASETSTAEEATQSSTTEGSNEAVSTATAPEVQGDATVSASSSEAPPKEAASPTPGKAKKVSKQKKEVPGLPFDLPDYSAPFLFIPAYLEVSFPTCSAIYVRHPTARPGYSEIPTPFDADGEVMRLGWEFYKGVGRRRRGVEDIGDEDATPAGALKDLYTAEGKRNWTANWEDTQLEKRHMRAVRQGRGRWAHRPL